MRQKPAAEQHLLLVAAGKIAYPLMQVGGLDPQLPAHVRTRLRDRPPLHEPEADEIPCERGDPEVVEHVERQEAPGLLAVCGNECHAACDRGAWRVDHHLEA